MAKANGFRKGSEIKIARYKTLVRKGSAADLCRVLSWTALRS